MNGGNNKGKKIVATTISAAVGTTPSPTATTLAAVRNTTLNSAKIADKYTDKVTDDVLSHTLKDPDKEIIVLIPDLDSVILDTDEDDHSMDIKLYAIHRESHDHEGRKTTGADDDHPHNNSLYLDKEAIETITNTFE